MRHAIARAIPLAASVAIPGKGPAVALAVHAIARIEPFAQLVLRRLDHAEEGASVLAATDGLETVLRETTLGVDERARKLPGGSLDDQVEELALERRAPRARRRAGSASPRARWR